jgi:hypothetical protein
MVAKSRKGGVVAARAPPPRPPPPRSYLALRGGGICQIRMTSCILHLAMARHLEGNFCRAWNGGGSCLLIPIHSEAQTGHRHYSPSLTPESVTRLGDTQIFLLHSPTSTCPYFYNQSLRGNSALRLHSHPMISRGTAAASGVSFSDLAPQPLMPLLPEGSIEHKLSLKHQSSSLLLRWALQFGFLEMFHQYTTFQNYQHQVMF